MRMEVPRQPYSDALDGVGWSTASVQTVSDVGGRSGHVFDPLIVITADVQV